jgi:hypothetical protein
MAGRKLFANIWEISSVPVMLSKPVHWGSFPGRSAREDDPLRLQEERVFRDK